METTITNPTCNNTVIDTYYVQLRRKSQRGTAKRMTKGCNPTANEASS